MDEETETLN